MARSSIAVMLVALAACGGQAATTAGPSSVGPQRPTAEPPALCGEAQVDITGTVANAALAEASGLVASRTHAGVLWSHNDGGAWPGIFALGLDGSDLGVHRLPVELVDVEDMAIAGGTAGDDLYLADIGDNGEARRSIAVVRFPEPDPSAPGPIAGVERFEFSYPDRPHNAETLLVDEANGVIVIVTKEQADSLDGTPDPLGATETSYVFEGRLDAAGPVELTAIGTVDTVELETRVDKPVPHLSSLVGFGGVPTGGDVSADRSLVALRTYEAIWLWQRSHDQRVAEVFASQPCQVVAADEVQGEAIAFADEALLTLGEGVAQPVHRIAP